MIRLKDISGLNPYWAVKVRTEDGKLRSPISHFLSGESLVFVLKDMRTLQERLDEKRKRAFAVIHALYLDNPDVFNQYPDDEYLHSVAKKGVFDDIE